MVTTLATAKEQLYCDFLLSQFTLSLYRTQFCKASKYKNATLSNFRVGKKLSESNSYIDSDFQLSSY